MWNRNYFLIVEPRRPEAPFNRIVGPQVYWSEGWGGAFGVASLAVVRGRLRVIKRFKLEKHKESERVGLRLDLQNEVNALISLRHDNILATTDGHITSQWGVRVSDPSHIVTEICPVPSSINLHSFAFQIPGPWWHKAVERDGGTFFHSKIYVLLIIK